MALHLLTNYFNWQYVKYTVDGPFNVHSLLLTPNSETVYSMTFLNLKEYGLGDAGLAVRALKQIGVYPYGQKDAPAANFWSTIVYDVWSRAMLANGQEIPSKNSYDHSLQYNEDGSNDLYYGPEAPEGKESNWRRTLPGSPALKELPAMNMFTAVPSRPCNALRV